MLAFQRDLPTLEGLNAQVLGVSFDDVETLRRFAAENGIGFPLISDPEGKLKALYSTERINYLIDAGGVVRHIERGVPDNRNFVRELERLRAAP